MRGQTAVQTASRQPFSARVFFEHFRTPTDRGAFPAFRALYRGAGWTTVRNSVGCFALFGTSSVVKDALFGIDNYAQASVFEDVVSSGIAAAACVVFASPFDVLKVRIQAAPLNTPVSGWKLLRALLAKEGALALFKGLAPKLLAAGPKIAFGYTVSQQLARIFSQGFGNSK